MVVQEDHVPGLEMEDDLVLPGELLDFLQGFSLDLGQARRDSVGISLGASYGIAREVHKDAPFVEEEDRSVYLGEELSLAAGH
jgi:hypothetical protein